MAPTKCHKCKEPVSDTAERCPRCDAHIKGHQGKPPRKWYERTSVTLCVAGALVIIAFGFIHVITGVESPYDLPFDIILKESFGYRETLVDAKRIKALPYIAAKIKYPLGCEALQRKGYMSAGPVFEMRMIDGLRENMRQWLAEFENTRGQPERRWQDQLQGDMEVPQTSPQDGQAHNARGIAFARKSQYEAAISEFTRALRRAPACAEAFYNRGLVYVAIGNLGRAIADFSKVVEIKPRSIEGYMNRGCLHVAMSQYDQAISDFTKVIEIAPQCAEAHFRRSLVFHAKGEYDEAWQDVHKVRNLGLPVPSGFLKALRGASGTGA
jgi:tetratricopeptide (TPR) repeat protein